MLRCTLSLMIVLLASTSAMAQGKTARILPQPDAPIRVLKYLARYESGGTYVERGILHAVEYENGTTRKIVAVQIGLVSFDVWNEFIDQSWGIDLDGLDPGKRSKGAWTASAFNAFQLWTGVAYVSKVRFEDGEIWVADLSSIVVELRKIQDTFDPANLKSKPPDK